MNNDIYETIVIGCFNCALVMTIRGLRPLATACNILSYFRFNPYGSGQPLGYTDISQAQLLDNKFSAGELYVEYEYDCPLLLLLLLLLFSSRPVVVMISVVIDNRTTIILIT
jgi:hypothetical protein